MTQFEFISVFASIIMGLGLAHLFTGAIQQVYRRQIDYAQSCYALLALPIIVLNWWALFAWEDEPAWSLLQFLVLALWSLSMFVLCVAIYPPGELGKEDFAKHQRVVALAFAAMVVFDILQTAAHGSLLQPPSYLPVVSHFIVVALVAAFVRNQLVQKIIATYLPVAIYLWGFVWTAGVFVRRPNVSFLRRCAAALKLLSKEEPQRWRTRRSTASTSNTKCTAQRTASRC